MKQGKTLTGLANRVEELESTKRDFVADSRKLKMRFIGDENFQLQLDNGNGGLEYIPTTLCHEQISSRIGIPKAYYDRMQASSTNLFVDNVNHWFENEPQKVMVRTLEGKARAFMSDKYRPLDNYDLLQAVLPILVDPLNEYQVESCEVTEKHLYIKVLSPKIQGEVKVNDLVQAGICISNSEVGLGAIKIEPLIYRLVCKNGMIMNYASLKRRHVGRGYLQQEIDDAYEVFSDATREADDKAFFLKVSDVVRASFDQVRFDRIVDRYRETSENRITRDPVEVVEITQKRFGLSTIERGGVLTNLIQAGELSQYGLANAVTRHSQEVHSYDRATELERIGGSIIELPKEQWSTIGV